MKKVTYKSILAHIVERECRVYVRKNHNVILNSGIVVFNKTDVTEIKPFTAHYVSIMGVDCMVSGFIDKFGFVNIREVK